MDLFEILIFSPALRATRKLLNLGPWPKYGENRGRNGLPGTRKGNYYYYNDGCGPAKIIIYNFVVYNFVVAGGKTYNL